MISIYHQLAIVAPVARVYAALSSAEGIGTWWDKQTPVQTDQGLVLEHNPGAKHGVVRLKVVELIANQRVEWQCISNHPAASPASAWTGTHFIFVISDSESPAAVLERGCNAAGTQGKPITTLDFRQTYYDESSVYTGFNNFAWAMVLNNLKTICESKNG